MAQASSSSTVEYPQHDGAMNTWEARVRRVARRLDIPVEVQGFRAPVRVRLEDLELLADKLANSRPVSSGLTL